MSLEDLLRERLAGECIPASHFMALALYHPKFGYYRRSEGPWGFEGKDYYTALDIGPLLGETLALRLQKTWERLERPSCFTVLEPGAGRGWLGRDLLNGVNGDFAKALVYLHQDDNPGACGAAEIALEPFLAAGRARLVRQSEALEPFLGAVISNELFDALPAQPWRWDGEGWSMEVLTSGGSAWTPGDPGEAGEWFSVQAEGGLQPGDGSVWCEELEPVLNTLVTTLKAGLFLTIDYGAEASRLLAKGADLRRYKGHAVDGEWWKEPGRCDLTADVDFTRLTSLLEQRDLREVSHVTLSRWIREHAPLFQWESEWAALDAKARMRRMENLFQLTLPGMMGERFRVLEGWKEESC